MTLGQSAWHTHTQRLTAFLKEELEKIKWLSFPLFEMRVLFLIK